MNGLKGKWGDCMDEIDYLPIDLRRESLSDREIVLPYSEVLKAIDILVNADWAVLSWEGWLKYSDGKVGHSSEYHGTVVIEQDENELWHDYVVRSASFCRRTIEQAQQQWNGKPEKVNAELYYCIVAIPSKE